MTITETVKPVQHNAASRTVARTADRTKLCITPMQRVLLPLGLLLIFAVPLSVNDPFLISLGVTIGISSVAVIGLNVLLGYAGQISLAQSVFVAVGAFAGVAVTALGNLPLIVWLPATFIAGGLAAAIVAPLTLRLKGVFQIVLSLGLIFIGHYIFVNSTPLTGGNSGIASAPSLSLGFVDLGNLTVGGMQYSYEQGLFILVWLCVAAAMIAVVNMHRTRFGRSMIAVREGETAAQVAGINPNHVKVTAFILAGAFGGLAGGLLLAQFRYVQAEQFGIKLGLQLLIIAVVGGLGSTWGPVVGSAIIASIPVLATQYARYIPFLQEDFSQSGAIGIPVGQVGLLAYGLALVLVMLFEPRGLAHLIRRAGIGIGSMAARGTKRG